MKFKAILQMVSQAKKHFFEIVHTNGLPLPTMLLNLAVKHFGATSGHNRSLYFNLAVKLMIANLFACAGLTCRAFHHQD